MNRMIDFLLIGCWGCLPPPSRRTMAIQIDIRSKLFLNLSGSPEAAPDGTIPQPEN
jgi:hypothetical protein